jgi:hypothetical protein
VLYRFGVDAALPGYGDLVFDLAGTIYGTTISGGTGGSGTVYQLMHSHDSWTETVLYSFTGQSDGAAPYGGVIFDNIGNLYGTTAWGGMVFPGFIGDGVVFQLTPSGSGWIENVLYTFLGIGDGAFPFAGLTMDQTGDFYGTTNGGGEGIGNCGSGWFSGCGTVFKGISGACCSAIYSFSNPLGSPFTSGPLAPIMLDAAGNLYGTTQADGTYSAGNIFELTSGQYAYTSLYDFTGGNDGSTPISNVVRDNNGNLYGTAFDGGSNCQSQGGCGVIWEIRP